MVIFYPNTDCTDLWDIFRKAQQATQVSLTLVIEIYGILNICGQKDFIRQKELVGVAGFASEDVGDGFDDNLDIEEEAPIFDVPDVFLDALFHHPELGGFTS